MRVVIADDEKAAIELIEHCCNESSIPLEIVGKGMTVLEAVKIINEQKPDLVFLDIQFPDGNGFDVLDRVNNPDFLVIFVTAYKDYAIDAIKRQALDYIVKPIDFEETEKAIQGAHKKFEQSKTEDWSGLLDQLQSASSKIRLPIRDGYLYVLPNELEYLKADGSYTECYFTDGRRVVVSKKLGHVIEEYLGREFIRVHRSYVINKDHILEFHRDDGGYILTTSKHQVPVSKQHREDFS